MDAASLLAAYDEQLRTDAETPGASSVTRHGPLRLVTFAGGRGFITYRSLDGEDADGLRRLVPEALAHYRADPAISRVEWKTRGHDHAPGLHEALLANGFTPGEPDMFRSGIYLGKGAERPGPARGNLIQENEITGFEMAQHCVGRSPSIGPDWNTMSNNTCK